jgi:hypothetical protein
MKLIRYEVKIDDNVHGIFRIPQNTDVLDDIEYDLYLDYYNQLPFHDLGDLEFEFYFTELGEKAQEECMYVSSALKAIPYEYELIIKEMEIDTNDNRILYIDHYQVAVSSLVVVNN